MLKAKPALQYSEGRSSKWGGARLVNCFAEKADGDKRDDFALIPTPGLTEWAAVAAGPCRGGLVVAGVPYVVSGGNLYSVDNLGTETLIGAIPGTGPVRMAANATELCIAADGTGYVYSGGSLTTPLPFDVCDVLYIDGYILWVVDDSEQFFISALDDALTYDAADIASVEGLPDNIAGAINDHREIYFFGEVSTEIFYNSGNAAFPIERQGNAFIERGCLDRDSIVKIDNNVMFVGNDRIVYNLAGYQPQRVSTHAIEYHLRNITYARGFTYSLEGHQFYCLECDNGTFVFDRATGAWHQRQSWDSTFWRCNGAVDAYGSLMLTSREDGKLFTVSPDVHTEDGETIAMDIYIPAIEQGRELVICHAFEMDCETGVGNSAAADPQVMLRYSDDGGHRWSNEMWRTLGAIGSYRTRAVWRKLGQFRTRQFHIRITDAVRRCVIGYWLDME